MNVAELYDADGLTAYFSKALSGTIKALGVDQARFVSASLRRHAEADWTALHTPATARAA